MDEHRLFLDEIVENPDDDIPRQVYADFLEETGDPRGEFIRVQCQLAQTDELQPEYFDLVDRGHQLLAEHQDEWAAEVQQDVRKIVFHRGFIDTITMTARAFIKEGERLLDSTPVHWLRFNYLKNAGEKLAESKALRKLRYLDLSGLKIPVDDLMAVLRSRNLTKLFGLNLNDLSVPLDANLGQAIKDMPASGTLREFEVSADQYSPAFAHELATGNGMPELRHLGVGRNYSEHQMSGLGRLDVPQLESLRIRGVLRIPDVEEYCRLPLHQVTKLNLPGTMLPARGAALIAEQGGFRHLEELNLRSCDLGISAAQTLFAEDLTSLVSLDLFGTYGIGRNPKQAERYADAIAGCDTLKSLKKLSVSHLVAGSVAKIVSSPRLKELVSLQCAHTTLGRADGAALANSAMRNSLGELKFTAPRVNDEFVDSLIQATYSNLTRLSFDGSWDWHAIMSEHSIIRLIESAAFPSLRVLDLSHTDAGSATMYAIAAKSNFPELRELHFNSTRINDTVVDDIMQSERIPKLRLLSIADSSGLMNQSRTRKTYGDRIHI